jgi:hypothetical protein
MGCDRAGIRHQLGRLRPDWLRSCTVGRRGGVCADLQTSTPGRQREAAQAQHILVLRMIMDKLIRLVPRLRPYLTSSRYFLRAASTKGSTKRWNDLRGEQLKVRLRPPWRQSGWQRPRVEVGDRDGIRKVADHANRRLGVDDL